MKARTVALRAGGIAAAVLFGIMAAINPGCRNTLSGPMQNQTGTASALGKNSLRASQMTSLVANAASYNPVRTDANLTNAWGIAFNPNGIVWISANHSGLSVVYDQAGNQKRPPVSIPTHEDSTGGGAPTGIVFNPTTGFMIASTGEVSKFIFAQEDGIISAWSSGNQAKIVADRSADDAVYKGLAMAWDGGQPFLYATNFKGGSVDVFDSHFQRVTNKPFMDPDIPAGFSPFGIQTVDGVLFVSYAMLKGPDNEDDQAGPGNGFIDVFSTGGTLLRRFASHGSLNSPWGIAQIPDEGFRNFGRGILVGDFGDGRINVFSRNGKFLGQLTDDSGTPITIPGLWGLSFGVPESGHDEGNNENDGDRGDQKLHRLFFTAGPNDESDGVFGTLDNTVSNREDD